MPLPGEKSNSFFSNSLFIFIARFFPSMANLLVMIWYSKRLPQEAYGHYQHFWVQLNVIYPLACFGIHVLIVTYHKDVVRKLAARLAPAHYVIYGAWVLLLAAVFAWLQGATVADSFMVPFLFLTTYAVSMILESVLIVFRNYTGLIITNILYAIAYCGIHLYATGNDLTLHSLFFWLLLITLARLAIFIITVYTGIARQPAGADVVLPDLQKTRSLWLHLGIYDVSQMLFSWVDKFVMSFVLTAAMSAVYYNGSQNIPFLPLLLSAAGSAALMQLADGRHSDESATAVLLMNRLGRVLSCIVFPLFFFLFFFREQLLITLLTEKYRAAIPVFAVALLVLPVKAYSFTTVLQRMHKGAIINAGALADLVLACGLMYPLYLWLGLPGVALSFVISTYLQAAFYLIYSARLLKVSPLKLVPYGNWFIKFIVFASVLIGIRYVCELYFTGMFGLILGGSAMMLMIIVSLYLEMKTQKHGNPS